MPKCGKCKKPLKLNGYAKAFRPVLDIDSWIWLLARVYNCDQRTGGCGHNITTSESDFLNSMPIYMNHSFPFVLSKRGGITKRVLDLMMSLDDKGIGPSGIRSLILELHSKRHSKNQVIYFLNIGYVLFLN